MKKHSLFLFVLVMACAPLTEKRNLQGKWTTTWYTDASNYTVLEDITSFEMNGLFEFDGDNLTITAYGFEGCVFGSDTISHTQKWQINGDTLMLINDQDVLGFTYTIMEFEENAVKLLLVDDIYLQLIRAD